MDGPATLKLTFTLSIVVGFLLWVLIDYRSAKRLAALKEVQFIFDPKGMAGRGLIAAVIWSAFMVGSFLLREHMNRPVFLVVWLGTLGIGAVVPFMATALGPSFRAEQWAEAAKRKKKAARETKRSRSSDRHISSSGDSGSFIPGFLMLGGGDGGYSGGGDGGGGGGCD